MSDIEKELPDAEGWWWNWHNALGCWLCREVTGAGGGGLREIFLTGGAAKLKLGRWRRALTPDQEDALRAEVAELRRQLSPKVEEFPQWRPLHPSEQWQIGDRGRLKNCCSCWNIVGAAWTDPQGEYEYETQRAPARLPDEARWWHENCLPRSGFAAMDGDGAWHEYASRPEWHGCVNTWILATEGDTFYNRLKEPFPGYEGTAEDSLHRRPEKQSVPPK